MFDSGITGLINYGSQCFVNAVIQSLAGCRSIVNWLQYSSKFNDQWLTGVISGVNSSTQSYPKENKLTSSLLTTIQSINQRDKGDKSASSTEVLNALRYHRWRIPHGEQDAHELFNALTTTLESELYSSLPVYSLSDAILFEELVKNGFPNKSTARITTRGSQDLSTSITGAIPRPLPTKGLLASQLQCTNCGYKYPVHLEGFYSVSLAMPTLIAGSSSLQSCLNKFVSNEVIQNVRCEECSKSGDDPDFVKRLTFAKLPQILCIHIHRLMWLPNGMTIKKSNDHLAFPEYLTMDDYVYQQRIVKTTDPKRNNLDHIGGAFLGSFVTPYPHPSAPLLPNWLLGTNTNNKLLSSNRVKYRYRLVSTIVHIGDSQSGHFVTYRRSVGKDSSWYLTSDHVVRPVTLMEVLSQPAYMLFYERLRE